MSVFSSSVGQNEIPGLLAGRSLAEWNAAYERVESYFHALGVQNRVLLGRLVTLVIERAMRRVPQEPSRPATELATEEMDHLVTEWFGEVLGQTPAGSRHTLSVRGRLALLLADMPGKWQDQFLRPGPWPMEFVQAMRETYLYAGPDFQLARMTPRPLDLGPIATLTELGGLPYFRMVVIWAIFGAILVAMFILTHSLHK